MKLQRTPITVPRQPQPTVEQPYGYIYITTNLVDGKQYLGQHSKFEFDPNYIGSGKALKRAIRKYGKQNFKCEPIEWAATKEELDQREIWWIDFLGCVESEDWYNLSVGGEGYPGGELHPFYGGENHPFKGRKLTEEHIEHMKCAITGRTLTELHKEHISESLKGKHTGENNPMFGYKFSEEQRQKFSEERMGEKNPFHGHHHTQESIAKMLENRPDQSGVNNPNYGNIWSEEQRINNNTSRKIVQLDLNGKFICKYDYIKQVKGFGFYPDTVSQCCRGKINQYKGYKWMYLEDYMSAKNRN